MSDRGSVSSGGDLDLVILLPDGRTVQHTANHNCAMMDLLIQIASKENLKPSAYVIEPLESNSDDEEYTTKRVIQYKPNTPVGMLNTQVIRLALKNPSKTPAMVGHEHKIAHSESFSNRVSNFNRMSGVSAVQICNDPDGFNKLSEDTKKIKSRSNFITSALPPQVTGGERVGLNSYRLQLHLPYEQLHVIRAQPEDTVDDVLDIVREERGLKLERYDVLKTNEPDLIIDTRRTLKEYSITELTLKLRPEYEVARPVNPKTVKKESSSHFKSAFKSFFQHLKPASRSNSVTELRSTTERVRPKSEIPVINHTEFVKPRAPPRKRAHAPPPPTRADGAVVCATLSRSHTVSESSCESVCEGSVGGSAPATLPRRCRLGVESVSTTNLAIEPPLPALRRGVSDLAVNKPKYPRRKRLAPKPPIPISNEEIKEDGFEEQLPAHKIDPSLDVDDHTIKMAEATQTDGINPAINVEDNIQTLNTHNISNTSVDEGISAVSIEKCDIAVNPNKPIIFEQETASGHKLIAVNIEINDEFTKIPNQEREQNKEEPPKLKLNVENIGVLPTKVKCDISSNSGIHESAVLNEDLHYPEINTAKEIQLPENTVGNEKLIIQQSSDINYANTVLIPKNEIKAEICNVISEEIIQEKMKETSQQIANETPEHKIINKHEEMISKSLVEKINNTPEEQIINTVDKNIINTLKDKIINTPEEELINKIEEKIINTPEENITASLSENVAEKQATADKEIVFSTAPIASQPASDQIVESISTVVKPESKVLPTITRNVRSDNYNRQTSTLPPSKLKDTQISKAPPQRSVSSGSDIASKPTVDELLMQIKKIKEKSSKNAGTVKKTHRKSVDQPEIVGILEKLPPIEVFKDTIGAKCVTPPVSPVSEVIPTLNGSSENKPQLVTKAANQPIFVEKREQSTRARPLPTFMLTSWAEEKRAPVVNRIAEYGTRSAISHRLQTDQNNKESDKGSTNVIERPLPYALSASLPRPFIKPSDSSVSTISHKLPTVVNMLEKSEAQKINESVSITNGRQSVYSKLKFYNTSPTAFTGSFRENGSTTQKPSWQLVQDANKKLQECKANGNHSNEEDNVTNNNNNYTNGRSFEKSLDDKPKSGQAITNGQGIKNGEDMQNGQEMKNDRETRNVFAYRKPLQFQLGTWNDKAKSIKIEEHVKLDKKNDPPLVKKIDEVAVWSTTY